MARTAYVVTAKNGLEAFVYTEVVAMRLLGCDIVLFTTKLRPGPYMPHADWTIHGVHIPEVLAKQPLARLRYGRKYLATLREAVAFGTVPDFLIGAHYARVMEREGITHIHCHMGDRKLFVGYFAHKLTGIPLSSVVHAHEMLGSAPMPDGKLFRLALSACEKVVTISEYNKRFLNEQHGIPRDKIRVVRLFTGKPMVLERMRKKKLLLVANMVPKKGHGFLLEALGRLGREDWTLWIAGRFVDLGPERTVDVPRMVREAGMTDQVKVLGEVSDEVLRALYDACDIFCVPSVVERSLDGTILDQEGIPEVLKEAMTMGKPVIATRHTGMPEILQESLVDEHDVSGLAAALERLLESAEERRRQGEENRRRANEIYTNEDLGYLKGLFGH